MLSVHGFQVQFAQQTKHVSFSHFAVPKSYSRNSAHLFATSRLATCGRFHKMKSKPKSKSLYSGSSGGCICTFKKPPERTVLLATTVPLASRILKARRQDLTSRQHFPWCLFFILVFFFFLSPIFRGLFLFLVRGAADVQLNDVLEQNKPGWPESLGRCLEAAAWLEMLAAEKGRRFRSRI